MRRANSREHRVAREMAVGVVDQFEVIQIGQHHADRTILAAAANQFALENIQNRGAIPNARQKILGRLLAQFLSGGHQLALQVDDAGPGAQPHFQLVLIERLGDVIVRAGFHALDQVSL